MRSSYSSNPQPPNTNNPNNVALNFFHFDQQSHQGKKTWYSQPHDPYAHDRALAQKGWWIKYVKWALIIAVLCGLGYAANQALSGTYEKLRVKWLSTPAVTLYLNNGCKGKQITISSLDGRLATNKRGQYRGSSFCDLNFEAGLNANDQVRSVRVHAGKHVLLYEHCTGPAKFSKGEQGKRKPVTVGPFEPMMPVMSAGWLDMMSKCHDLEVPTASYLELYSDPPKEGF